MKAVALVTQSVLQSAIKPLLERRCAETGIELSFYNVTESCAKYSELYRSHRNVITWNCRMPHDWSTRWNNNVLYVENSLLWQRAGIFIDRGGFFSRSNLCRKQTWQDSYDVDLNDFTQQNFKWKALSGGDPSGPILVCLQNTHDCNLQLEFPLGNPHKDKIAATLELLYKHLPPNRNIIIRPHPRFLDYWKEHVGSYRLRSDWRVDWSGDFYSLLPTCSTLVTVNSTCASEAVSLGLPVATLGVGAFTGSGATLDCSAEPRLLRQLGQWQPDLTACRRYVEAILGRHYLSYSKPMGGNAELEAWLRAAF